MGQIRTLVCVGLVSCAPKQLDFNPIQIRASAEIEFVTQALVLSVFMIQAIRKKACVPTLQSVNRKLVI